MVDTNVVIETYGSEFTASSKKGERRVLSTATFMMLANIQGRGSAARILCFIGSA